MAAVAGCAFTTGALKEIIKKYGKRIRCIQTKYTSILCNMEKFDLPANQPWVDTDNIITFNADGYDMIECRNYDYKMRRFYTSVYKVSDIIGFQIAEDEHQLIDPYRR